MADMSRNEHVVTGGSQPTGAPESDKATSDATREARRRMLKLALSSAPVILTLKATTAQAAISGMACYPVTCY